MAEFEVSFVVPFRDRDVLRVTTLLESIRRTSQSSFEFIVSDYGSNDEVAKALQLAAKQNEFRIVRSEAQGVPWNRAHAINNGARQSCGKLVGVVDVDMVFWDHSIDYLLATIEKDEAWFFESLWPQRKNQNPRKGKVGRSFGAFMLVGRDWLERLNGFCEDFEFWGAEDTEWAGRLERNGCHIRWLSHQQFALVHTWHRIENVNTRRPFTAISNAVEIQSRNLWLGYSNPDWGRCLTASDRPILQHVKNFDGEVVRADEEAQDIWLAKLKTVLGSGQCAKLVLGPRLLRRALTPFAGIWLAFGNFINRFSLRLEYTVNENLETILALRKVLGSETLDIFLLPDYSAVYLVARR